MSARRLQSVLYVDDDPDICTVVQTTLCLIAGLHVRTAASGEQGIALACELAPDLILMDVMMPGLDGPSTFKLMREIALIADIPVIFLTAKVLPFEVAHFLKLGAIGVIGKPFDPVKLCDHLLALWNKADAAATSALRNGHSQLQAEVDLLMETFLQRARDDVICLRGILERASPGDRSAFKEARRIAHSIHGAAAIFGFPHLSASGGAIERLLEGVATGAGAHHSGEFSVLIQQLSDHAATSHRTSRQPCTLRQATSNA